MDNWRATKIKRAKPTPTSAPPSEAPTEKDGGNTSRRKSLRGQSPAGKLARQPCRDYIKGKCTRPSCDFWYPPECQIFKKNRDADTVINVRLCSGRLKISPAKNRKRMVTKVQLQKFKDARQLGCAFQEIEPTKSSSILRQSTKVLTPIRRVQFSKATLRHANIRESNGPSLGIICPANPCERSFYRTDLRKRRRDKSDAPAETRGECPRVSESSTKRTKLLFSPTEAWCLPSLIKPKAREIDVDSTASMHTLSRKDRLVLPGQLHIHFRLQLYCRNQSGPCGLYIASSTNTK